ncbi:hypothetical protein [Gluconacetobacter diazotrophicus]|uniref:hypothetical protein n=1 Tax=Gluconacetobacter diazotrophicus TaxID=33996 RepID=UPI001E401209|nr:hypothetical protein [Gluconacetobacter diazotrophicus]
MSPSVYAIPLRGMIQGVTPSNPSPRGVGKADVNVTVRPVMTSSSRLPGTSMPPERVVVR